MEVKQNSQKFRVLYGNLTKLTDLAGTYMMLCPYSYQHPDVLQSVGYRLYTPAFTLFSDYFPTKRAGTGMRCCTRILGIVSRAYKTYRSSGCGNEWHTELKELTKVLGTGMSAVQNVQKHFVA